MFNEVFKCFKCVKANFDQIDRNSEKCVGIRKVTSINVLNGVFERSFELLERRRFSRQI